MCCLESGQLHRAEYSLLLLLRRSPCGCCERKCVFASFNCNLNFSSNKTGQFKRRFANGFEPRLKHKNTLYNRKLILTENPTNLPLYFFFVLDCLQLSFYMICDVTCHTDFKKIILLLNMLVIVCFWPLFVDALLIKCPDDKLLTNSKNCISQKELRVSVF